MTFAARSKFAACLALKASAIQMDSFQENGSSTIHDLHNFLHLAPGPVSKPKRQKKQEVSAVDARKEEDGKESFFLKKNAEVNTTVQIHKNDIKKIFLENQNLILFQILVFKFTI